MFEKDGALFIGVGDIRFYAPRLPFHGVADATRIVLTKACAKIVGPPDVESIRINLAL
jgi:hypothetical protein